MEKDIELLTRAAANHLILGQFEPLRASLLSLRARRPELALAFLRRIVFSGGRVPSALPSPSVPSPAHLAWLAALELLQFPSPASDPAALRLKTEFLLLLHLISSSSGEISPILSRLSDLGLQRLRDDVTDVTEASTSLQGVTEEEMECLRGSVLEHPELFDALCVNIERQVRLSEPEAPELAIVVAGEAREGAEGLEALVRVQRSVQLAHLDALRERVREGDADGAVRQLRFLRFGHGVDEIEYRVALQDLIKISWSRPDSFGERWQDLRSKMTWMYSSALSSSCVQLVQIVQAIQDEVLSDEIEQHTVSDANIPLPLKKYLKTLTLENTNKLDAKVPQAAAIRSCIRDLYHYARISGIHILECVVETALSAVRMERLHEASDVLSLFPLLQPLVAVLGWDLLSGKTAARRTLMQQLWTSKSQVLRLEEHSLYGKQSDEISCVEYLCDILCFRLDVAFFVACVNSGRCWSSKFSLLFSQKEQVACEKDIWASDPFVENLVLERLAVESPMRVLFDVVPGIEFQDAIELMSLQPIASTSAARNRMQDIELMHMRYALESAVFAFGAMERFSGDENESQFSEAIFHLKDMQNHIEAVTDVPRKIFLVSIVTSLLHMDDMAVDLTQPASSRTYPIYRDHPDPTTRASGNKMVISFTELLLDILHHNIPAMVPELENLNDLAITGRQALEWRIFYCKSFVEDWEWRLSILQRLEPLSERTWSWKEALVILRAAPSKLLNLCMQKAKYDIGEEAVHRFSLPPEDKAVLELAEWVAGAFKRASVEDAVSRVAEGIPSAVHELDISSFRAQLGPLPAILLCIDVAATSAKSVDMCKLLLAQAKDLLSEIYPGSSPEKGPVYWDQIQEITIISVTRHVLQRLHDFLEQENATQLQNILVEEMPFLPSNEPIKQGQRQRALVILHQMIDDAHKGKRQFLSGKLHNLARAVVDEDADGGDGFFYGRKFLLGSEKGAVLGLGIKAVRPASTNPVHVESSTELPDYDTKDPGKRFFGPIMSKPTTFLSSFIIYIATIGDIVDGIDTTHDFNFFSLIYEWPKDLLTRLVFERGSTDAAGKVADIMCVDFVHEVISACVPPVFPPRSGHGWACMPLLPTFSRTSLENKAQFTKGNSYSSFSAAPGNPLYPLQLNIVKHLAKLSPVRAVLACVFGSSILSSGSDSSGSSSLNDTWVHAPDDERLFYEFSLDQSERFPTLNRWIQMQSNLHRVSESAIAAKSDSDISFVKSETKISLKRYHELESDTESEIDDVSTSGHAFSVLADPSNPGHVTSDPRLDSPKHESVEVDPTMFLTFDWENEGPYEKTVERLINEGKLMDALALSDRCLRDGASDHLLKLLIERGEENSAVAAQPRGYGAHEFGSMSWQYCLRLKDKQLAAKLALKYLNRWELGSAMDVLTMCSCHLSQNDPTRTEVLHMKQALQRYNNILCADDHYGTWQEVEVDCKEDPEGLALRLAGKGAVSAALEVAESASLSIDLRRELQGRQLVKLLTADPLSGGGPAEASRFLSSLRDSDDALPVAVGAMKLLPDLRSKQLLVHFFLKRRVGNLSDAEVTRLNSWALGLRVLSLLPLPSQQRCSALHEHPHLILEVLIMMKQLQSASLILKEFPSLRDNNLILSYAAKAIAVNVISPPRESRRSVSSSRGKQKPRSGMPSRSSFTSSLSNFQKEARRAFSWTSRDTGNKTAPKDVQRKRKSSGLVQSERAPWEAMSGIQEDRASAFSADGQERVPFVPIAEEWILTGEPNKDNAVRSSHRYETSPDISLFKALLSLCSDESVSAKGTMELCTNQMKNVLSSQQLPLNASMESMCRAYHATETFVQALAYAKGQLRKLAGTGDLSSNSESSRDVDDISGDSGSSSIISENPDEMSELLVEADIWLGRAELLQSLLGSGIVASLDDIADKESSSRLRDRLIKDEQYSMAVYTSKKCKVDSFPVWNAWGHALLRIEHYAQARAKFKRALQLHKGDPTPVVMEIISTVEGGPPADVSAVRALYDHLAKSASTILDDSLSADSYLNVFYMPTTFPRSESHGRFQDFTNNPSSTSNSDFEDEPRSNLGDVRYSECILYLQEYARPQILAFMFRHGHYADGCLLFFPPDTVPSPPQPSPHGTSTPSSSPQRPDPLATDYGTIDDLCDLCIGYDAMSVLEGILAARIQSSSSENLSVSQHTDAALSRICNYCETHRHFNFLYKFQVLRKDHVAAGLCCIQLFMNSFSQEEAVKHLEHAKNHFEEGLSARYRAGEATKLVSKVVRGKSASEKLTEEGLVKFSARVAIQVDVVKSLNNSEGPQWKNSLFGNPNDPETFRRRSEVAETLAEKHFDLAFRVIYEFNLPAVDIYAGVASSLAERKKGGQLTEFLRNIKGTIDEDDWDQVLSAAINVYANKHKERPDRLIDMLISSHRKVMACVVCGRLKSAFQIASRSGSVADVQYVAHQALHANAISVLDMCKHWLAQYM